VAVHLVDPLADPRWDELLLQHARASVFHTRGWLLALRETYGYSPIVFTTSTPEGPLKNGVVFCGIRSWITGRRLVSLPFSDHCDPLADSPTERADILAYVCEHVRRKRYKYAEVRPFSSEEPEGPGATELRPSEKFHLHMLSLDLPLESLFRDLHKDCIQRKVRRAEREELRYEKGRSESQLHKFYQLLMRTRRRQGMPPQPMQWFRNLITFLGDHLTIRIASKGDYPVAAILTLSFQETTTYKYGCSDERLNHFGGVPFLFWKTIQEAKDQGMRQLDLGRSDLENAGLVQFKDRLGARRTDLIYYRLESGTAPKMLPSSRRTHVLKRCARHVPRIVLTTIGRLLYKHTG
jgi:CelD/BcsL family acetyltransferase involved in cellulose biosynthesis